MPTVATSTPSSAPAAFAPPGCGARRAVGDRDEGLRVNALVSFGEDGVGRLYAVSLTGRVFRVVPR